MSFRLFRAIIALNNRKDISAHPDNAIGVFAKSPSGQHLLFLRFPASSIWDIARGISQKQQILILLAGGFV